MTDSTTTVQRYDLTIPRGARFRAIAWALVDDAGNPLTEGDTDGLTVSAKVRRYAGDEQVLHTFATSLVQVVVPGQWGGDPVPAAQLDELAAAATAAIAWDRGVWGLMVDDYEIVTGRVWAPWVVAR